MSDACRGTADVDAEDGVGSRHSLLACDLEGLGTQELAAARPSSSRIVASARAVPMPFVTGISADQNAGVFGGGAIGGKTGAYIRAASEPGSSVLMKLVAFSPARGGSGRGAARFDRVRNAVSR